MFHHIIYPGSAMFEFEFEVCKPLVRAGDRVFIWGRVLKDGEPVPTAEVWLTVNGKYVKNRLTDEGGSFQFYGFFKPGVKVLRPILYRYRVADKELIVQGPEKTVVVTPSIKGLGLKQDVVVTAVKYTSKDYQRLTPVVYDVVSKYADGFKIEPTGGVVRRGYSYNDIDFRVVGVKLDDDTVAKIKDELWHKTCSKVGVASF